MEQKGQLDIFNVIDPKKDTIKVGRVDAQCKQILSYLLAGNSLTPIEALNKFDSFRLAAVVFTLKESGHNIITEIVKENGRKYARYFLVIKS